MHVFNERVPIVLPIAVERCEEVLVGLGRGEAECKEGEGQEVHAVLDIDNMKCRDS